MLVLTRKANEKIRIGPDVVISVISVSESQVKIGIEAPMHITILREELYENLKKNAQEAVELGKEKQQVPPLSRHKLNVPAKPAGKKE